MSGCLGKTLKEMFPVFVKVADHGPLPIIKQVLWNFSFLFNSPKTCGHHTCHFGFTVRQELP